MLNHENAQININVFPCTKGVVRALSYISVLKDYEIISWFFVSSVLVFWALLQKPSFGFLFDYSRRYLVSHAYKEKRDSEVIIRN